MDLFRKCVVIFERWECEGDCYCYNCFQHMEGQDISFKPLFHQDICVNYVELAMYMENIPNCKICTYKVGEIRDVEECNHPDHGHMYQYMDVDDVSESSGYLSDSHMDEDDGPWHSRSSGYGSDPEI